MSSGDDNNRQKSRLVWITGASSGIGRALALKLAERGNRVAVSARNGAKLSVLAEEAEGKAGSIHAYPLDITDVSRCAAVVDRITADLGEIELAVLNAGTHHPINAEAFRTAELKKLVDVNLLGTGNCLEPLLQRMIPAKRGHLAIVASVAGYRGLPTSAYYGATKAAQINMVEALKFDLDRHDIKLQLVDPGFVKTPLTDKNEFSMPCLIDVETAAIRMANGFESRSFEITFPRRFTYFLKLLRILPYRLYFPLVSWMTGK